MSAKNPKINKGFIDIFYVFKLYDVIDFNNSKRKYKKVLSRIAKSGLIISAENENKEVSFNINFNEFLLQRKRQYRGSVENAIPKFLKKTIIKTEESPRIYLQTSSSEISYSIEDNLEDELEWSQHEYLQKLVNIYISEEKHTGIPTKELKNRFLLSPPQISLVNEEYVFPGIYFTIFKHGYGILQMSINLNDYDFDSINYSGWDLELLQALVPELLLKSNHSLEFAELQVKNVNELLKIYADFIYQTINKQELTMDGGHYFYNLTLTDFSNNPQSYEKNGGKDFLAIMYKLLFAPLENYNLQAPPAIETIINKRYYPYSNYSRMYANNNRVIQVFTKGFPKSVESIFKAEDDIDISNMDFMNQFCHNTALTATISSVEALLLKKEASQRLFVFELNENLSQKKMINLLIKENVNYSIDFMKYFYTYASVRKMLEFLEIKCEDFLQTDLIHEREKKIKNLISLKKERLSVDVTIIGAILTIFLSLILSFPALKAILDHFNQSEYILESYLSVNALYLTFLLYLFRQQIFIMIGNMNNTAITFFKKIKSVFFKKRKKQ